MTILPELPERPADFIVHAEGYATVWIFEPKSEAAKAFIEEGNLEIEDWQWSGKSFAVDHRPARELAHWLADTHEFNVFNPSYGYLARSN